MLIDTHAHIYLDQFIDDFAAMMERASEEQIQLILMPNIDRSTTDKMRLVEEKFPDRCRSMMGLHPCSVKEDYYEQLDYVKKELETGKYIGVGEIGTDLYWDKTYWEQQKEAFNEQLNMAEAYHIPVVIHCRETLDETIEMVAKYPGNVSGVFHCFTGNLDQYLKISELGFFVGIGGVSTFKNSGMTEVLKEMSLDNVILETDSPYLAPAPMRGKRNEPSYLYHIALNLAQTRGMSYKEICEVTTGNAENLFKLK